MAIDDPLTQLKRLALKHVQNFFGEVADVLEQKQIERAGPLPQCCPNLPAGCVCPTCGRSRPPA